MTSLNRRLRPLGCILTLSLSELLNPQNIGEFRYIARIKDNDEMRPAALAQLDSAPEIPEAVPPLLHVMEERAGERRHVWVEAGTIFHRIGPPRSSPASSSQEGEKLPSSAIAFVPLNLGSPETSRRIPLSSSEGERVGERGPVWLRGLGA
jgi:hypothetical protein